MTIVPHSYRVGDEVETTYGKTGIVTQTTAYGVVLDGRVFCSQTLIRKKKEGGGLQPSQD